MIAEYEGENRDILLSSPRQYGIGQTHKHLPEMIAVTGLKNKPIFSPVVADFYSGMAVTVPLFADMINGSADDIKKIYKEKYTGPIVSYAENADENGFIAANKLAGKDSMEISVAGNDERILLISRYDNLGKGASGAAIAVSYTHLDVYKRQVIGPMLPIFILPLDEPPSLEPPQPAKAVRTRAEDKAALINLTNFFILNNLFQRFFIFSSRKAEKHLN